MSWKTWNGKQAAEKMLGVHRRAVQTTCFVVLAASKTEVPLDEGTLMRSGKVFMAPEPEAAGVVTYGGGPGTGGPAVPYALKVHEKDSNYQHGRKWHYLVDPWKRLAEPTLKEAITKERKAEF